MNIPCFQSASVYTSLFHVTSAGSRYWRLTSSRLKWKMIELFRSVQREKEDKNETWHHEDEECSSDKFDHEAVKAAGKHKDGSSIRRRHPRRLKCDVKANKKCKPPSLAGHVVRWL